MLRDKLFNIFHKETSAFVGHWLDMIWYDTSKVSFRYIDLLNNKES